MVTTHVLGVDGGNTKTVALVADRDGTILGAGRGGCGDIYAAGEETPAYGCGSPEAALASVDEAVAAALAGAGIGPGDLLAGAFSMAGADWPEDVALLRDALSGRGLGRATVVVNDALGALRAGSPDGTGVVVACGTGIATGARAANGRTWHSSFWQEPGGANELGRRTLRAVVRAELGLERPTRLTARVLAHYEQESVEGMLHLLTARGAGSRGNRPGALARVVMDEAATGDEVACGIVREAGAELGDYALVAARRVGLADTPFTLVLTGGVFRHPAPDLAAALVDRVRLAAPAVRPLRSRFEPVVGALLLALEATGSPLGDRVLERMAATAPPATLFET